MQNFLYLQYFSLGGRGIGSGYFCLYKLTRVCRFFYRVNKGMLLYVLFFIIMIFVYFSV